MRIVVIVTDRSIEVHSDTEVENCEIFDCPGYSDLQERKATYFVNSTIGMKLVAREAR